MSQTKTNTFQVAPSISSGDGHALAEQIDSVFARLNHYGVVVLENLLTREQLTGMQRAFESRLRGLRWNNFDGYEKTEPYRHMVQDILTLDQGFVDAALHPLVKGVLLKYLGEGFALTEAKGWKSIPTRRDFHGWHGDAWYDQDRHPEIPREVKLAIYLTDVRSGAFNYIKGSHRKQHPRMVRGSELSEVPRSQIAELVGPAGTAFMFDTSGVHRQGVPMLEPRQAVFYNYHDPAVRLQRDDIEFYRYHPLLLNAAFLGDLADDDQRVLGFGDKTNFLPGWQRRLKHAAMQKVLTQTLDVKLRFENLQERILARLRLRK
jgi:hypothetical protein